MWEKGLVWMLHTQKLNNQVKSLFGKALRLTYQNKNLSFDELLNKTYQISFYTLEIFAIFVDKNI